MISQNNKSILDQSGQ